MYETPDQVSLHIGNHQSFQTNASKFSIQEKPVYEAKGIETVRRDGVPSVVKVDFSNIFLLIMNNFILVSLQMLEKSLRILFETKDVSLVKRYVQNQFTKISSGKIPLQDLTFAREFRGMAGYRATACVPALELAKYNFIAYF